MKYIHIYFLIHIIGISHALWRLSWSCSIISLVSLAPLPLDQPDQPPAATFLIRHTCAPHQPQYFNPRFAVTQDGLVESSLAPCLCLDPVTALVSRVNWFAWYQPSDHSLDNRPVFCPWPGSLLPSKPTSLPFWPHLRARPCPGARVPALPRLILLACH